ncbi:MAG: protein translocase subunit SecF [Alphaproteobacteria bacterium]
MWHFRLIPDKTNIPFVRRRRIYFIFSALLVLASIGVYFTNGLNFGIDFAGGIMIEVKTPGEADLSRMRGALGGLGLGEVQLQEFGAPDDILIRVERQPGGAEEQNRAVALVKEALGTEIGPGIDYRRVEFVGPKVGSELIRAGVLAVLFSVAAMLVYIWLRFELPFGIGAVIALIHDVTLTIGMFAVIGLEFNLAIVAALLLIIGYSMNDTVVVYDRVCENLRKYKTMSLLDLLDRSINDTLARTVMTSCTTLLALLSLFIFGGEVIRGFSFEMIWGIVIGTYASIFIATPLLLYLKPKRMTAGESTPAPPAETTPKRGKPS